MNKLILKSALVICTLVTPFVYAGNYQGACAAKEKRILEEIDYAKQHNNTYKVAGLESALSNVKQYCKDSDFGANLESNVKKKEAKVAERQAELNKAKVKNDTKKIAKKEKKLAEAQQELTDAKAELAKYQK